MGGAAVAIGEQCRCTYQSIDIKKYIDIAVAVTRLSPITIYTAYCAHGMNAIGVEHPLACTGTTAEL